MSPTAVAGVTNSTPPTTEVFLDRLVQMAPTPGAVPVVTRLSDWPRFAHSNQPFRESFWERDLIESDFRSRILVVPDR